MALAAARNLLLNPSRVNWNTAEKVSAPPPAVAKLPADAPVPKVIVPMGAPFLWTSSRVAAVALTPA
jgi:hypothetical protein